MTSESRPLVRADASPPNIDVFRSKLDAAIVAEAWDAVTAIRDRIAEITHSLGVLRGPERARRSSKR